MILYVYVLFFGGHQSIDAYGVSRETTNSDLKEIVSGGRTIIRTLVKHIDFDPSIVANTNPLHLLDFLSYPLLSSKAMDSSDSK